MVRFRKAIGHSVPRALIVGLLMVLTPILALGTGPALAQHTPVPAATTSLEGGCLPIPDTEPGVQFDLGRASDAPLPTNIPVIVTFRPSDANGLGRFLSELSNPASPNFHQYISAREFDARFGASPLGYESARAYFLSAGVAGLTTYADRMTLSFSASPSQLRALFHVSIAALLDQEGRSYYAPRGLPCLPDGIAPYVAGVQGLSDYSKFLLHTESHAQLVPGSSSATPSAQRTIAPAYKSTPCSSAGGPFTCTNVGSRSYPAPFGNLTAASDLQVTYGTSGLYSASGYPTKTSVATILWVNTIDNSSGAGTFCASLSSTNYAAPFFPSDISNFFTYTLPAGEPKPHAIGVPIVDGAGQAPGPGRSASCDSGGNEFESTLDLGMVGSLAPGANVYEVYGDGGNSGTTDLAFADILNPNSSEGTGMTPATIAGLANVSVISNSWGYQVYNDTSWYSDLQQAQARGISVLAATPDSGDNTSNAPAGQAYGTFGDVAVGGTTVRLSSSTLSRTSEIAWYEGAGSHSGSGGGVADVTNPSLGCGTGGAQCFPEPAWQVGSADANAVIRAVGSGRGEPDISAIANDTVLSLTYAGGNYSILCLVNGCSFFIFSGNSVATPVEAGVIDTVDHALMGIGGAPVGFLDPVAYGLGQDQFSGNLSSKLPFFDVQQYGNANFSALRGYDLVTGWGPINALNLTSYLTPHPITFRETGLPSGTSWSVTIGGWTIHSNTSAVVFKLAYGVYHFVAQRIPGFPLHPSQGIVTMTNAPRTVKITY